MLYTVYKIQGHLDDESWIEDSVTNVGTVNAKSKKELASTVKDFTKKRGLRISGSSRNYEVFETNKHGQELPVLYFTAADDSSNTVLLIAGGVALATLIGALIYAKTTAP